jgi:Zn-dependent peptidase ImmA (M78 family)
VIIGTVEYAVGFTAALAAFEALGNLLAERLTGDELPPPVAAWNERENVPRVDVVRQAADDPEPEILSLLMKLLSRMRREWSLRSIALDPPEVLAVARMIPKRLPATDTARLLRFVNSLPPSSPAQSMKEASDAAQRILRAHSTARPYDQGYELASWFRKYCGIRKHTDVAFPHLVLKGWNVRVHDLTLHHSIDAVAVWGRSHGPNVIVNPRGLHSQNEKGRRATLAHEVLHLLVDRLVALPVAEVIGGRISEKVEQRAKAFAAEFLLPRTAAAEVVRHAPDVTTALDSLSEHWGVSFTVAMRQILNSDAPLSAEERSTLEHLADERSS